jgi:threonyl-tRNA synthetase
MAIVGKEEVENGTVSLRGRDGSQVVMVLDELTAKLLKEVEDKK